MKSCLILTGGKLNLAFARSFLEKEHFDKVIAVDGGLESAEALGITRIILWEILIPFPER